MRSLTYRQRLFVEYYLGESAGSAVDAARRAGYSTPHPQGVKLLKRAPIRAAIDARVATVAMAANEILARVADVASANLMDFMNEDGKGALKVDLKLVKRLGLGHLIKRLRTKQDGTHDIELEARLPALVKLGEHYSLWKGEAQSQLTLVDLAKGMRDEYERELREERLDTPAEAMSKQTRVVQ